MYIKAHKYKNYYNIVVVICRICESYNIMCCCLSHRWVEMLTALFHIYLNLMHDYVKLYNFIV